MRLYAENLLARQATLTKPSSLPVCCHKMPQKVKQTASLAVISPSAERKSEIDMAGGLALGLPCLLLALPSDDKTEGTLSTVCTVRPMLMAWQDATVISREEGLLQDGVSHAAFQDDALLNLVFRADDVVMHEACIKYT